MKFIDRMTVTSRQQLPLTRFLHEHERACEACHRLDSSPGALILDHLLANRWQGETFEDWLCRQVRDALLTHVQSVDWTGEDGAWEGIRTQTAVESIAFDAEDRAWLLERYGQHPEVLAVWTEACRQSEEARLAA
jgi:hypothetical protein